MSTPTPASASTTALSSAANTPAAKRRGSNRMPGRTRFVGRNSRSLKRMISAVEVAKGRKLTTRERSACASLSMPLTRDGGTAGR